MYCSKCGAKIEAGVKFCSSCGQATTASGGGTDLINAIDTSVRVYIAIALNIATTIMFALNWFTLSGISILGGVTGLPVGDKGGMTIFGAFSTFGSQIEPAAESGASIGGLIFLQILMATLLVIPVLNILSAVMLLIKKQRARTIQIASSVYSLAASMIFIAFVFIYNSDLSNASAGMSLLFGVSINFPAYIVMILGLIGVFLIRRSKEGYLETVSGEKSSGAVKRRRLDNESGLTFILPFIAFLPTILAQLTYPFMDRLVVGAVLGEQALASLGVVGSIMFSLILLSGILGFVLFQIVGRDKGNPKKVSKIFFLLSGALAVIITILAQVLKTPLVSAMVTEPQIANMCAETLNIAIFGILPVVAYNALSAINTTKGSKANPFYFVAIAIVLNIPLDWVFINVVSMGLGGAAIATVAAQVVSVVVYAIFTFSQKNKAS